MAVTPYQIVSQFLKEPHQFFRQGTDFDQKIAQLARAFFDIRGQVFEVAPRFFQQVTKIVYVSQAQKTELYKMTAEILLGGACREYAKLCDGYVAESAQNITLLHQDGVAKEDFLRLQSAKTVLANLSQTNQSDPNLVRALLRLFEDTKLNHREAILQHFKNLTSEEVVEDLLFSSFLFTTVKAEDKIKVLECARMLSLDEKAYTLPLLCTIISSNLDFLETLCTLKNTSVNIIMLLTDTMPQIRQLDKKYGTLCSQLLRKTSTEARAPATIESVDQENLGSFFQHPEKYLPTERLAFRIKMAELSEAFFPNRRRYHPTTQFLNFVANHYVADPVKKPDAEPKSAHKVLFALLLKMCIGGDCDASIDGQIDIFVMEKYFDIKESIEQLKAVIEAMDLFSANHYKNPEIMLGLLYMFNCKPAIRNIILHHLKAFKNEDERVQTVQIFSICMRSLTRLQLSEEERTKTMEICYQLSKKEKNLFLTTFNHLEGSAIELLKWFHKKVEGKLVEVFKQAQPLLLKVKTGKESVDVLEAVLRVSEEMLERVMNLAERETDKMQKVDGAEIVNIILDSYLAIQKKKRKADLTDSNKRIRV